MVIQGRTDKESLQSKKSFKKKLAIFKGTKKVKITKKNGDAYPRAGLDLEELIRLEPPDEFTKKTLIKAYSSEEEQARFKERVANLLKRENAVYLEGEAAESLQYSIFLKELPVLMAINDRDRTFDTYYGKQFGKQDILSGLEWKCDRRQVSEKREAYVDGSGDRRSRTVECNTPCPVARTAEKCPHGCALTGDLYLYIPKLLDLSLHDVCQLTVRGETDVDEIADYLFNIEMELGSAIIAPGIPYAHNKVLYILSRRKLSIKRPLMESKQVNGRTVHLRNGKKADDVTWAISLRVDPIWKEQYEEIRKIHLVRQLGGQPTHRAISQAYNLDCMEAEVVEIKEEALPGNSLFQAQLPLARNWLCGETERELLKKLGSQYKWNLAQITSLFARYGLQNNDFDSFFENLTKTGYDQIVLALQSETAKSLVD